MKIVKVTWVDASGMNSWQSKAVVDGWIRDGPSVMQTVGYLYKKSKKCLVICQSIHKDNAGSHLGEPLMIPIKHIIKLKELK